MQAFAGLYEHSPWVAERTFQAGISDHMDTPESLSEVLASTMLQASKQEQLELIRAHPDLAGKAAARGSLTEESNTEQSSAGLDQCSSQELADFHRLNDAYKAKFDFPFIMAVKNSNRHKILAAFEQRLEHDTETEFKTALTEINKIARLRLQAVFESSDTDKTTKAP